MIKTISLTLITAATFSIFTSVNDFHHALPTPVSLKEPVELSQTRKVLTFLKRDILYAEKIYSVSQATGINPIIFACLIETESEYNIKAKSKKGYVGLGQTPVAIRKQGFELVDLTLSACILKEKLNSSYAKGNYLKAIQLYKGGKNPEALKYSKQVMNLYLKVKSNT